MQAFSQLNYGPITGNDYLPTAIAVLNVTGSFVDYQIKFLWVCMIEM